MAGCSGRVPVSVRLLLGSGLLVVLLPLAHPLKAAEPGAADPTPAPAPQPLVLPGEAAEPFGRWQPSATACRFNVAAEQEACTAVRVDQRSAGVYRVSWGGAADREGLVRVLTFVGTRASGSEPMACRQALCELRRPIALELSTVSQIAFDARGLASSLPSAWPVSGRCQLELPQIRCQANALSGETWDASASLR